MATKPTKVEGAGVGIIVDGKLLSRVQTFSTDTDIGVEEVRELTNANIVESVEGTPTVTVQIEANQWGRRDNLAAITGMDGTLQSYAIAPDGSNHKEINQFDFDGSSCDVVVQVEEDSALARSMYIPACFVTSLSWNFDVGGSATESYTLESDNREWYWGDFKDIVVVSGYYNATLASGIICVGNDSTPTTEWPANDGGFSAGNGVVTPLFITKNGDKITDPATGQPLPADKYTGGIANDSTWLNAPDYDAQFSAGARYRAVGYRTTPNSTIQYTTDQGSSTPSSIGGIRKGMLEIFLVSGSMFRASERADAYKEKFLRLQTCSIDADLSREALDELGTAESFSRTLNFPISVTVNFSALASDLQEWHAFSDKSINYQDGDPAAPIVQFRDFVQNHGVLVKIYDDDETNASRKHLVTITVSGLRVASESFSIDAGGNGVQEFSCVSDNFVVS